MRNNYCSRTGVRVAYLDRYRIVKKIMPQSWKRKQTKDLVLVQLVTINIKQLL